MFWQKKGDKSLLETVSFTSTTRKTVLKINIKHKSHTSYSRRPSLINFA